MSFISQEKGFLDSYYYSNFMEKFLFSSFISDSRESVFTYKSGRVVMFISGRVVIFVY